MGFVIHGNLASTGHGMDFELVKLISQNVLSKWIRECTNCNCLAIKNELTLILSNFIENRFVWLSKRGSDGFRCDCGLWSGMNQFSEFSAVFPSISPSFFTIFTLFVCFAWIITSACVPFSHYLGFALTLSKILNAAV